MKRTFIHINTLSITKIDTIPMDHSCSTFFTQITVTYSLFFFRMSAVNRIVSDKLLLWVAYKTQFRITSKIRLRDWRSSSACPEVLNGVNEWDIGNGVHFDDWLEITYDSPYDLTKIKFYQYITFILQSERRLYSRWDSALLMAVARNHSWKYFQEL